MNYIDKKNINEAIHQKLRKKDVYESDFQNIYNIILGLTDVQLQEKAAPDATFQAIKADQYLIILKRLCFSNQSEQHPIRSLCLSMRRLYNTMQYTNDNTTDYLVRLRNSQKFNEACNGRLITKGVQEHGMNTLPIVQCWI